MQTVREIYHDAILYNEIYLCCIIPILLERQDITLADSVDTMMNALARPEVGQAIRKHPSYREYRYKHVELLKKLEIEVPNPNDVGFYNHIGKKA